MQGTLKWARYLVATACLISCGLDDLNDLQEDGGIDSGADSGTDTDSDTDGDGVAISVSAGGHHTCAVIDGGYMKCWGNQQYCELGYGYDPELPPTGFVSSLPSTLPFVDVGEEVAQIVAGGLHTCALLASGGMKCWGSGSHHELGVPIPFESNGTIGCWDVPADYAAIVFGVAIMEAGAGDGHTCVLLEDGEVVCWGYGLHGELGYGTVGEGYDESNPAASAAVELGGSAVQISTGMDHTCAVIENGDVLCWGDNQWGQLGYGNIENVGDDEVPADVVPVDLDGPAVQVSCGDYHTCALLDSGEVMCWGLGDFGMLGYGDTNSIGDDETPASIGPVDVGTPVEQITLGSHHTCALVEGGNVKCWGQGVGGQLGYGNPENIGDDEVPTDVGFVDIGAQVMAIDSGQGHTCVLTTTGTVRCWGIDDSGQLGYGDLGPGVVYIGDDETPADMGPVQLF